MSIYPPTRASTHRRIHPPIQAQAITAEHQRDVDLLNAEELGDTEDREPLPPLEKAGTYDRPLTFRPPRSASRRELERRSSRPPAAAIEVGCACVYRR